MERFYEHDQEPLVSITIATYNRARLLLEQALPSALTQTYRNIEIIVIGDHCTDETPELMAKIKDPRVRFLNLPERPRYPTSKVKQWKVSGLQAINLARNMARGLWIAQLDDDDVFTPDHVERLLAQAQDGNCEFVSGRCRIEIRPGEWIDRGSLLCKKGTGVDGHVSHSTVVRRTYTKCFTADRCLEIDAPGDSYVWTRMVNAGVRTGFVNDIMALQPLRPGEKERSLLYYLSQC
jgi:glycosyltransferase involved in cell wall biosynthesis